MKRGFKANLLTDAQAGMLQQQTVRDATGLFSSEPIMQQMQAVGLFCLARRHPSSAAGLDEAFEKISPNVVEREHALQRWFKKAACQLHDPKGCYELTVQLRDRSHLKDVIFLKNPRTQKWE